MICQTRLTGSFIGCDPGWSAGALVALHYRDGDLVKYSGHSMPADFREIIDLLVCLKSECITSHSTPRMVIEQQTGGGTPRRTIQLASGKKTSVPLSTPYNAMRQGENYGFLVGACWSLFRVHLSHAHDWQAHFGLKGLNLGNKKKLHHRDVAQLKLPGVRLSKTGKATIPVAMADAALLALYAVYLG